MSGGLLDPPPLSAGDQGSDGTRGVHQANQQGHITVNVHTEKEEEKLGALETIYVPSPSFYFALLGINWVVGAISRRGCVASRAGPCLSNMGGPPVRPSFRQQRDPWRLSVL